MKHTIELVVLSGLIALSAQAIAGETPSDSSSDTSQSTTMAKSQAMKDCMAKQKATNSGLTHEAMKTTCKNEASGKKTKDGNDLATGTQPQS
jgi:hypothetical protein